MPTNIERKAALTSVAGESVSTRDRWVRLALLALWAATALWLASGHVFWRDEVRAFTIALQGETVIDMLRGLHGEGHPALWYLLLRGAHALVPVREVLPVVAFLVAAAAMALLALRAPFRAPVIGFIMFGAVGLYEFTVSARNYGISMLVLFAIAELYPRYRDRGVVVGLLLAVLCNTNVPANFLAAGLLGFWLVELIGEEGWRWTGKHWRWLANVAVAAAGAALCFLQVFPTVHDAAVTAHPDGIDPLIVARALANPVQSFPDLATALYPLGQVGAVILLILLVGTLAGMFRAPAAFLTGLGAMLTFQLFFQLVYPGTYRHEALLLIFFVTLYWLVARGRGGTWPDGFVSGGGRLVGVGAACFAALLALQVPVSLRHIRAEAAGIPYSRSRDLAMLLTTQRLGHAILMAEPDEVLEAIPYYTANPIYLLREQRFGRVKRFTRAARLQLSLGEILDDAERLGARWRRPVVLVIRHQLDTMHPRSTPAPYIGAFTTTPEQVARFAAATRRLATFAPAMGDESYDVFLLTLR